MLTPTTSKFSAEYAIRGAQENRKVLETDDLNQVLVCADEVNLLGQDMNVMQSNAEIIVQVNKEIGIEVDIDKTKHVNMT
jgi:hypothetical protein